MRTRLSAAGFLAAAILVATPAGAAVETPVYLHCNGETKIGNVHATADGVLVSWNETKPAASYISTCTTMDTFIAGAANHNPIYDFPIQGSFSGEIDNITIRLWGIDVAGSRAFDEWTVDVHLQVDGVDILKRPTLLYAPIAPDPAVARLYEVTVTDIAVPFDVHDVQLTVYSKFIDGSGVVAWVYDSAEFDSGLVFNDTTPAAITVARNA